MTSVCTCMIGTRVLIHNCFELCTRSNSDKTDAILAMTSSRPLALTPSPESLELQVCCPFEPITRFIQLNLSLSRRMKICWSVGLPAAKRSSSVLVLEIGGLKNDATRLQRIPLRETVTCVRGAGS